VLSEAYSNDDFRTRVASTYDFVRELLAAVAEDSETILAIHARRAGRPDSIAVRSVLGPPVTRPVVAEITEPAGEGNGGYARRRRSGVYRRIEMPVYERFVPARREALPEAYFVPERLKGVVELLGQQGVEVERLDRAAIGPLEAFVIDSISRGPLFEGHRTAQVEGRWGARAPSPQGPGWLRVPTAQPLGVLAAYLLEPASEDGVVTWNLLDAELAPGRRYPILRSRPNAAAHAVPRGDSDAATR
jgi:dipeptidyl-peptidase 4